MGHVAECRLSIISFCLKAQLLFTATLPFRHGHLSQQYRTKEFCGLTRRTACAVVAPTSTNGTPHVHDEAG